MSLMVAFHPLFYIYIRTLVLNEHKKISHALHFIPAFFIFFSSGLLYLLLKPEDRLLYVTDYLTGTFSRNNQLQWLYSVYIADKIIFSVQAVTYTTLVIILLKKHRRRVEHIFSYASEVKLHWLRVVNIFLFFISLNGILINLIPLEILSTNDNIFSAVLLFFTVFYGTAGTLGSRQKKVYDGDDQIILEEKVENYQNPKKKIILEKLTNHIVLNKPYLKADLKITDISSVLGVNRNYLSKLINEEFGKNFCQFVNSYRIEQAIVLMKEIQVTNDTLENIAYKTGFSSFTSFYRAFLSQKGETPGVYIKKSKQDNN
jgi:AraC-like DNA-binding protein